MSAASTSTRATIGIGALGVVVVAMVVMTFVQFRSNDAPSATVSADVTADTSSAALSATLAAMPISNARKALRAARTVLVVGDSTGNEQWEWVQLWSATLAQDRKVALRMWQLDAPRFGAPTSFGSGRPLAVWNLSQAGSTPDYSATRLGAVQAKPDLVIWNYGHNSDAGDISAEMDMTQVAIEKRWGKVPAVYLLQNPSTDELAQRQADTVEYMRYLAKVNHAATVDVWQAFTATNRVDAFIADGTHPNVEGEKPWARAVEKALYL